jgi:rare lipoprotein A
MVLSGGERSAGTAALFLAASVLAGCSLPPFSGWRPTPPSGHYAEVGTASWYGPGFTGNATSSGEIYDVADMTAAHQTLPLGTRVVVTNLVNGKSIEVRINDRGPFAKGRIIDLSFAAAHAIDLVGPGTASVRVESIDDGDGPPGTVIYAVQAGSFLDGEKASALRSDLASRFADVYLSPFRTPDALYYRVRLGPFERRDDATVRAQTLFWRGFSSLVVEEVRR